MQNHFRQIKKENLSNRNHRLSSFNIETKFFFEFSIKSAPQLLQSHKKIEFKFELVYYIIKIAIICLNHLKIV